MARTGTGSEGVPAASSPASAGLPDVTLLPIGLHADGASHSKRKLEITFLHGIYYRIYFVQMRLNSQLAFDRI
jgi:hypothetical protein